MPSVSRVGMRTDVKNISRPRSRLVGFLSAGTAASFFFCTICSLMESGVPSTFLRCDNKGGDREVVVDDHVKTCESKRHIEAQQKSIIQLYIVVCLHMLGACTHASTCMRVCIVGMNVVEVSILLKVASMGLCVLAASLFCSCSATSADTRVCASSIKFIVKKACSFPKSHVSSRLSAPVFTKAISFVGCPSSLPFDIRQSLFIGLYSERFISASRGGGPTTG